MKALVFKGINEISIMNVPEPEIDDNEILVKVDSCSICGTDVRTYKFGHPRIKGKRILGHEFSGIVAKVGGNISDYKVGDRVIVVPGIPCGKCYYCQHGLQNLCDNRKIIGFDFDGGFAEYVKVPEIAVKMGNVKHIPDSLSLRNACLIEPFTAVYNGQNLLNISIGSSVAIIGGGPIGLMHSIQARYRGASKIALFDLSEDRCKMAEKFDIDFIVNSAIKNPLEEADRITKGKGFDVVIVSCSSGTAQLQALQIVRKGGRVSFFAGLPHNNSIVQLDTNLIHYKQIGVFGANGSGPKDYDATIDFLSSVAKNVSDIISVELSIDEALKGFEIAQMANALKVVIHPNM
ncbi:zinc-dependent dehydrogenase [Thermoanaerobacter wiegelii]|uniref:Alcohol dehydrogenase GroES domain protein n=1 Tax=Thermoanaerobacter wiegelii Rt8.B1 TaxID=697303 RepID=G2MRV3_9THEO|nr:zinc-dependent dehydrogenase [Thermoanaerobacter wiegelii]AEM77699.1 Alcohol dehydrogenase GroES domain protein [Thermoanaerobacter wiegelii Rt8.B1]